MLFWFFPLFRCCHNKKKTSTTDCVMLIFSLPIRVHVCGMPISTLATVFFFYIYLSSWNTNILAAITYTDFSWWAVTKTIPVASSCFAHKYCESGTLSSIYFHNHIRPLSLNSQTMPVCFHKPEGTQSFPFGHVLFFFNSRKKQMSTDTN